MVNGFLALSGADAKVRVFEASKLSHVATLREASAIAQRPDENSQVTRAR